MSYVNLIGGTYAVKAVVKNRVGDLRAFAREIGLLRELVSIADSWGDELARLM